VGVHQKNVEAHTKFADNVLCPHIQIASGAPGPTGPTFPMNVTMTVLSWEMGHNFDYAQKQKFTWSIYIQYSIIISVIGLPWLRHCHLAKLLARELPCKDVSYISILTILNGLNKMIFAVLDEWYDALNYDYKLMSFSH
jgi:hypothetical protein